MTPADAARTGEITPNDTEIVVAQILGDGRGADERNRRAAEHMRKLAARIAELEARLETARECFRRAVKGVDLCDATKAVQPINSIAMLDLEDALCEPLPEVPT